ncbi:MAG: FlgD immunoglobulin-like domain containing protein [Candidatus Margulisiibacteriota bacterium]
MKNPTNFALDPRKTYKIAKEYAYWTLNGPVMLDNVTAQIGIKGASFQLNINELIHTEERPGGASLVKGSGACYQDPGLYELMPEMMMGVFFPKLLDAKLADDGNEPLYSVVYGQGSPLPNVRDSAIGGIVTQGIKYSLSDVNRSNLIAGVKNLSGTITTTPGEWGKVFGAGKNVFDEISDSAENGKLSFYNGFMGELLTVFGSGNFAKLPTEQAKFLALIQSNPAFVFSDDGDSAVPVDSAKGLYQGKSTRALRNANFYPVLLKSGFDDYLKTQFPGQFEVVVAAYYLSTQFVPEPAKTPIAIGCQYGLLLSFMERVNAFTPELQATTWSHTNTMLRQYDVIEKAILDTEAIFTVNDLQTTATNDANTLEAKTVKVFTTSVVVPSGYHSVQVKSAVENRNPTGLTNLPIPMTLDGQRMYVTQMTVTKPPKRIAGKLNYLIPRLMKQFEYSFNFAAWKPITGVDQETGEFELDDLPFAEGQNILAIRSENGVGIKSHQLLKIILNTIPMQPSQFKPLPEYYVATANPEISVEFNKSEYTGDYDSEKITIKGMTFDGEEVAPQVESSMEAYHPWAKASYKANGLSDGEHNVAVRAESNVGVAQGLWTFYVDTTAPTISIEPLAPYSPRGPTTIRYTVSDEVSPNLRFVRCDLYDKNDTLVTTIATADSLSKGENYFTLDPRSLDVSLLDGSYKIKIKAFDLAGNVAVAETPLIIDATPPKVGPVALTPNPMTSNTNELKMNAEVSEKALVVIKLNNLSNKTTTAYLAQAGTSSSTLTTYSFLASYAWPYNNSFAPGPEDGIYRVEVIARDEAGNESAPRTLEAVRIDRTPPTILGQIANPYVLTNIGANAYKTTLTYNLRENGLGDKGEGVGVKVKIFNASTGLLADAYEEAPASLTEENKIVWHSVSDLPKGAYKFQITATDDVGNTATAYSSCVKDGIAPSLSFPAEDGAEISGLVAIRGTAMDPDWSNDKPFKQYRVYLARGDKSKMEAATILSQASELVFSAIEVPLINRGGGASNISLRPLQNDATLAYLNTNGLENGDYTILVVVDEENGDSLAVTRLIKVNNGSFRASAMTAPYVKLKPLASTVDFKADDSVKLQIGFINSVKSANVYVEILKSQDEKLVYFKYFPNILGAPFIGKPDYKAGTDLGYFIWSDESGYHIRWSADGSSHKFSGNLIAMGGTVNITGGNSSVSSGSMISWNKTLSGGEGGFDFTADGGQLMITPKLDEDPSSPSIYADNVYLGITKQTQQYLPLVIDVAGQRLVSLAGMGQTSSSIAGQPPSGIDWDGRLDTGAYVDNGSYIVKVIAEGVDGQGLASAEAVVNVTTPFELKIKEATNKEFSSLSVPDRVSIFYNVSKDALITAQVQKENGDFVASLAAGKESLGTLPTNPLSLVWTGNYPDNDSTQVVTGGTYKLILTAAAKDGSGNRTETISGIKVVSFARNEALVKLEPIGEEVDYNDGLGLKKIRLADGESPLYFEAKGYGNYHPVKDLTYTLSAQGKQKLTAYPYVSFAGLMHRGFNEVDTKIKVIFKIHAWNHYLGAEDYWALGRFWNPMKWRRETKEWVEEKWIAVDSLPSGAGVGTVFKVGDQVKNYTFNFDSYNWWPQNENDHYYNKDKFGCGIDAVDVQVEVYTKNSGFILDKNVDWLLVSQEKPTSKGIFRTAYSGSNGESHYGTLVSGGNRYDKTYGTYQVNLTIKLEAPIAYSRLTNRFVPWFGFVRANEAKQKDFSEYLTDINRGLGFPGKLFFDDPSAKPDVAYKPKTEIEAELAGLTWEKRSQKLKEMSEQANLLGYKDALASSVGYDSYLSDGYYEFVPITYPDQANISKSGFDYTNDSSLVKVHTDLTYHGDGNPQSPFEFSWPWRESEYTAFLATQETQRKRLDKDYGGEPQNYTAPTIDGTFWTLDPSQVNQRKIDQNNSKVSGGQIHYNKATRRGEWSSTQNPVTSRSVDQIMPLPSYVYDKSFKVESNTPGIKLMLSSSALSAVVKAEDQDINGFPWTTADDTNLAANRGYVKSPALILNPDAFRSKRLIKLSSAYQIVDDYKSTGAARFTFLKKHPWEPDNQDSPVDNPNLEIDRWEVIVKDKSGAVNKDVALENVTTGAKRLDDALSLKLKIDASEARYVEIKGSAPGPYELLYYDGKSWQSITQSFDETPTSGRLAWWNVSRLNGEYTVMLRAGSYISTQNVSIGTLIKKDDGGDAWSTYKRAQLKFPPHAFGNRDQLATVTPVTMKEIKLRNKPIILTSGPIVEIKPSWKFTVSSLEGVDLRPTLRFVYTFDELKELGAWNGEGEPKNLPWNIHQVTEAGDLQIVSDNQQTIEENNGEKHYVFYAALDHFSTYALLPGKFKLSAPIVLADRYITNKNSVTIYGTAEPGSVLGLKVSKEPISDTSKINSLDEITADEKGNFRIENVPLIQEGASYIYVTAHPQGNSEILTCGDVMVTKDTIPPTVGIAPNLYAFSPNGDGKYDSVDYLLTMNEKGKIYLGVKSDSNDLINIDAPLLAGKELKVNWSKEGFKLYRRDNATGLWTLYSQVPNPSNPIDGGYSVVGYAIDEAGNISDNIMVKTIIDLTPPKVLGLTADPNPFTPNDDGVKDATSFWYKFSEPVTVSLGIYREDGGLFKNTEGETEKFTYPTTDRNRDVQSQVPSVGQWSWDGRGNRNELLGGNYSYFIYAEDWVGNTVSSEVKQIVVDRAPTLIPYVFFEPDPFSSAKGTIIKYYLAQDDLKVTAAIVGERGKVIKNLLNESVQGKGEHQLFWSGDLDGASKAVDGSYTIKIKAVGDGLSAEATNTVRIDNTSPTVILQPLQIDYTSKQGTIIFSIPEEAKVDVSVVKADGSIVVLMSSEANAAGEHQLSFSAAIVGSDGQVMVSAVDRAQNEAAATVPFSFLPPKLQITDHLADPAIFTPNGDGHTDTTRIAYKLSGGRAPYIVNVNIANSSGTSVKRLADNDEQSAGSNSFYWDGKSTVLSSVETYVSDGDYQYQVSAVDADGVKQEVAGKLEVAGGKITSNFNLSAQSFSPNGDGVNETLGITYSINYPPFYNVPGEPQVLLAILAANGDLLYQTGLERAPGTYTYVFDGKSNFDAPGLPIGSSLTTGKYYARITIQDSLGTVTSLTKDFAVDVTNPEVVISSEAGMIANPSSFSTNANPDGSDRPRSTTLYYKLTEDTLVSVKVYKIDGKKDYQRTDFTADNLIATLVNGQWQSGGQQYQVNWDGKMASGVYADPGKYAFIVEGADTLGNTTLRKWGGTVWIQNNVLTLRTPEQLELATLAVTNNPDPRAISPNGNSQELAQKRARFYFMIDLSLAPATVEAAERIEAMGVTVNTKPVGKYSVKVYSDSAMANLVRTITPDAVAQSGTLSWEDWDGKADGGAYSPNGNYWLAVELQDYAGNKQPLLIGQVTVDNTLPEVKNVLAAPYFFAPGGTNSSLKTTTCSYEVADNSGKVKVVIGAYSGSALVKTLTADAWQVNGNYSIDWDGSSVTGYVGSANGSGFIDGEYTLKIMAYDEAGNSSVLQSANVKVDTLPPDGVVVIGSGNPQFTSSPTVELFASASEPTSGVNKMSFSNDGASWSSWEDYSTLGKAWLLPAVDGTKTVRVRLMDNAGNYSTAVFADQIVLDSAAPVIKSVVQPQPVTINSPTTSLLGGMADFNGGADTISGINNWQIKIVNSGGSVVKTFGATVTPAQTGDLVINQEWVPTGLDGYYYYYFTATDAAGNAFDSRKTGYGAYKPLGGNDTYYRVFVDKTPPAVDITSPTPSQWYKGTINISGSASDSNPGPYKLEYAIANTNNWTLISNGNCPVSGVLAAWNTTALNGDYDLRLSATDEVGNYAEKKITIRLDNTQPVITIIPVSPITFNPYVDGSGRIDFTATDPAPSGGFSIGNISSVVRYNGQIVKYLPIYSSGGNSYYVLWDGTNISGDYENEGSYSIEIGAVDVVGNNAATASLGINLQDNQRLLYNLNNTELTGFDIVQIDIVLQWQQGPSYYEKNCGKEYQINLPNAPVQPRTVARSKYTNYAVGNYQHVVSVTNGNVYYKRIIGNDTYGPIKVYSGGNAISAAICAENTNDSYIAWLINVGQFYEIYFQKIPVNFAPSTGTKLGASAIKKGIMAIATLESPSLLAPAKDRQDVQNIRPAFEWQHHKADTTEYRVEVAKNDSFTIDHQTFSKAAGTGTQDKSDSNLYAFNYAIHEFDPGLERNTDYFWKVTALSPTNSATSETWGFRIQPELTLVGVTNYPNPFNPNREQTKIRYRLSADADEVRIRIYDITGSLVTELDGTTNGEGMSVWQKYNDVSWDGRNGRGDLVVNGIYPFEIMARIGDKTVSGRGKIAVLK